MALNPLAEDVTLAEPDDSPGESDAAEPDETPDDGLPPGADLSLDWGLGSHLDEDGKPKIISRTLTVAPAHAGMRLDHFVKLMIPRLSRTKAQQIIAATLFRSNADPASDSGTGLRSNDRVAAGEAFVLRRAARAEPPCPRNVAILYEDADVLVVDKPAGLPVHSTAKFYFNTLTRILFDRYGYGLHLCHRLDRETSGVVVVARNRDAASLIKQAFAKKTVRKTYIALVWGDPEQDEFVVDAPLRVATRNDATKLVGLRMVSDRDGAQSITKFSVVERAGRFALVRCYPQTGRQHQIRAHLALVGTPIVGDKIYAHGDEAFLRFCNEGWRDGKIDQFLLWRQALHAAAVDFPHPDGTRRQVAAPLPNDMAALFAAEQQRATRQQ